MFRSLGSLLQKHVQHRGMDSEIITSELLTDVNAVLEKIFGKGIHRKAVAAFLRQNTVTIFCSSSILIQELRLQEQKILQMVSQKQARRRHAATEFRLRYQLR